MNEEKSAVNGAKPRKKKRSLWWLWLVLILAAYAGGVISGLELYKLEQSPSDIGRKFYAFMDSHIPGPAKTQTPAPVVTEEPAETPAPTEAPAPAETPAPEATPAPVETPATAEAPALEVEEILTPETPAPSEEESARLAASETAVFMDNEPAADKYIGVNKALEIATRHAEVATEDADVTGVFRTKDEDGNTVYEVGFKNGDLNYDYVIDAVSGEIVGWKMTGFAYSESAVFYGDEASDASPAAEEEKIK